MESWEDGESMQIRRNLLDAFGRLQEELEKAKRILHGGVLLAAGSIGNLTEIEASPLGNPSEQAKESVQQADREELHRPLDELGDEPSEDQP